MQITLAFDVYGTLIDTHGVTKKLEELVGERAKDFSVTWREKQLEYSFRRALMQNYVNFPVCTRQALDFTCDYYGLPLTADDKRELMEIYRVLPPFEETEDALQKLKDSGYRMYAFSNGTHEAVESLLANAGIRDFFLGVVSVDEIKTFKPNPAVYLHFLRKTGSASSDTYLISGNPFDVIGAVSAGLRAVWVRRSEDQVFDPWGIEPTITVKSLLDLDEAFRGFYEKV